ncbi:MAG TPA: hypothetical protein VF866_00080, partial [Xanthobacteraceae bacterium]
MKLSTSAVRRNAANVWGAHGAPSRQTSLQNSRRNRTRSAIFLWQNPGASLQHAFCKSLFVCGRPHTVA